MMGGKNPAADKALQKLVDRRLQQSGGAQAGLKAVVVNGCVTVTGKLKVDNQRMQLMKAVRGVPGVKNLIDQVQGPPKHVPKRPEQKYTPAQPAAEQAAAVEEPAVLDEPEQLEQGAPA
jgi:BON domain-containing protein